MAVKKQIRVTYYAPACGRSFLTKRGACMAQARRALRNKYGEPFERETGAGYDPVCDEDMQPLLERYFKLLMKGI